MKKIFFLLNYLLFFILITLIYSLSKLLLYFTQASDQLPDNFNSIFFTFINSYAFDASLAASLFAPFLILSFIFNTTIFRYIMLTPFAFIFSDMLYLNATYKHITYEYFNAFDSSTELLYEGLFKQGFLPVLIIFVFFLFFYLVKKFPLLKPSKTKGPIYSFFALMLIMLFFVRGGIRQIPISKNDLSSIGSFKQNVLGFSPGFYFLRASLKRETQKPYLIKTNFNQENFSYLRQKESNIVNTNLKKKNIIVILLEGWSASLMSSYNNNIKENATPFFDKLRKKSISPKLVISDARRTSSGTFATFCAYPNPFNTSIINSYLSYQNYFCIPHYLKKIANVKSIFVQGTFKNTSQMDSLLNIIGFDESYGKNDYPSSYSKYKKNTWGFFDDQVFDFSLELMDQQKSPFLIAINTNTTHDLELPEAEVPYFGNQNKLNSSMSSLYSADQSLQRFWKKLETKGYLDNSVIILLADHVGGFHLEKAVSTFYSIPGLIFSKGFSSEKSIQNLTVHQRDMLTTALQLNTPHFSSNHFIGQNFLSQDFKSNNSFFDNGYLGWITEEKLYFFAYNKSYSENLKCFLRTNNFSVTESRCNTNDTKEIQRALNFTYQTQNLLFEGETVEISKPNSIFTND